MLDWILGKRGAERRRPMPSSASGRRPLRLEPLEGRAMLATITVTGTGDTIAVDGFVTLREALTSVNIGANANADVVPTGGGYGANNTIRFNIFGLPGTVRTIQPQSALPTITQPVLIDGYTQLGSSPNTLPGGDNAFLAIELDGSQAGFHAGLTISGGSTTVQGLVINRFLNEGILVFGAGGNVIRGNFLGTDATGKLDRGNGISGVSLLSGGNTVGGTAPADRNLISGNNFAGVAVVNSTAIGNVIQGNFIGVDDTGAAPLPNLGSGVRIQASGTIVGGVAPGAGNRIAFNSGAGVQLGSSAGNGNAIVGNAIFLNGGLGIDLGGDGATPNDPLDVDPGPNGLQNAPAITAATTIAGTTTISGTLASSAGKTFVIELFASDAADPSGSGEGQTWLGSAVVTTDGQGAGGFTFHPAVAVPAGKLITATATEFLVNNTSEFSAALGVSAPSGLLGDANGDGKVDLTDFGILKQQFGQSGPNLAADFDKNGAVDLTDFGLLKENFGKSAAVEAAFGDVDVRGYARLRANSAKGAARDDTGASRLSMGSTKPN